MENIITKCIYGGFHKYCNKNVLSLLLSCIFFKIFVSNQYGDDDVIEIIEYLKKYLNRLNLRNVFIFLIVLFVLIQCIQGGGIFSPYSKSIENCSLFCRSKIKTDFTCNNKLGIVFAGKEYIFSKEENELTISELVCLMKCIDSGGFNIALLQNYNSEGALKYLIKKGCVNDLFITIPNDEVSTYVKKYKDAIDAYEDVRLTKEAELKKYGQDLVKSILNQCCTSFCENKLDCFGNNIKYISFGWEPIGYCYDNPNSDDSDSPSRLRITFHDIAEIIKKFKCILESYGVKVGWKYRNSVKLTVILSPDGILTDGRPNYVPRAKELRQEFEEGKSSGNYTEWGCFENYEKFNDLRPKCDGFNLVNDIGESTGDNSNGNGGFKYLWEVLQCVGPFCINYFILPLKKDNKCNITNKYIKAEYLKNLIMNTYYESMEKLLSSNAKYLPIPLFVTATGWCSDGKLQLWQYKKNGNYFPLNKQIKRPVNEDQIGLYSNAGFSIGNQLRYYNNILKYLKNNFFGPTIQTSPRIYFYQLIDNNPNGCDGNKIITIPDECPDILAEEDQIQLYYNYYGIYKFDGTPKGEFNFPQCTLTDQLFGRASKIVTNTMIVLMLCVISKSDYLSLENFNF